MAGLPKVLVIATAAAVLLGAAWVTREYVVECRADGAVYVCLTHNRWTGSLGVHMMSAATDGEFVRLRGTARRSTPADDNPLADYTPDWRERLAADSADSIR